MQYADGFYIPQTMGYNCMPRRKRSPASLIFAAGSTIKDRASICGFLTRGER